MRLILKIICLGSLFSGMAALASESCPYSLVEFREGESLRIGLIADGSASAATSIGVIVSDITQAIESYGKTTPNEAHFNAIVSNEMHAYIGSLACELNRDSEVFADTYSAPTKFILSSDLLEPTFRQKSGQILAVLSANEVLVRENTALILRAKLTSKSIISIGNISEEFAGVIVGKQFIPMEFVMTKPGVNMVVFAAADSLNRYLRSGAFPASGLSQGDLVQFSRN